MDVSQEISTATVDRPLFRGGDLWTLLMFFAVVFRLGQVKGWSPGLLALYGIPPVVAVGVSNRVSAACLFGKIARIFLALLSIGLLVAPWRRLFPDMGGAAPNLALADDRLLTWYVALYLVFFFEVVPFAAFGRSLRSHYRGEHSPLSRFTSMVGLGTCLLILPALIGMLIRFMHLWPVFR